MELQTGRAREGLNGNWNNKQLEEPEDVYMICQNTDVHSHGGWLHEFKHFNYINYSYQHYSQSEINSTETRLVCSYACLHVYVRVPVQSA